MLRSDPQEASNDIGVGSSRKPNVHLERGRSRCTCENLVPQDPSGLRSRSGPSALRRTYLPPMWQPLAASSGTEEPVDDVRTLA